MHNHSPKSDLTQLLESINALTKTIKDYTLSGKLKHESFLNSFPSLKSQFLHPSITATKPPMPSQPQPSPPLQSAQLRSRQSQASPPPFKPVAENTAISNQKSQPQQKQIDSGSTPLFESSHEPDDLAASEAKLTAEMISTPIFAVGQLEKRQKGTLEEGGNLDSATITLPSPPPWFAGELEPGLHMLVKVTERRIVSITFATTSSLGSMDLHVVGLFCFDPGGIRPAAYPSAVRRFRPHRRFQSRTLISTSDPSYPSRIITFGSVISVFDPGGTLTTAFPFALLRFLRTTSYASRNSRSLFPISVTGVPAISDSVKLFVGGGSPFHCKVFPGPASGLPWVPWKRWHFGTKRHIRVRNWD